MPRNRSLTSALSTLVVLALVALVLSYWTIGTSTSALDPTAAGTGSVDPSEVAGGTATPGAVAGPGRVDPKGQAPGASGPAAVDAGDPKSCGPGVNGGSTDVGVSDKSILLASTVVTDGPGSSFLGAVRLGMNAIVQKVNHAGGICGRRLDLRVRNDSWDGVRGRQYIQNFIEADKVFALAVVPSSEGLLQADSYIRDKKVPVVGTDGMLIHQYRNPWIWPVATPTISTMHIMANDAYQRSKACNGCAQEFGIVFDAQYHFGVEGAFAFNQAVKRLTGKDIPGFDPSLKSCKDRFCGIQPNRQDYTTEARAFNTACGMAGGRSTTGRRCDFVAILLEPETALSWFRAGYEGYPTLGDGGFGGAQPLFSRDFAQKCGIKCNSMWVWTGYLPPIEQFAVQPKVAEYVSDLRAISSSVDSNNQFVEGGYLGMALLVEGLRKVGGNVTRERLRAVLDNMTFDSGLSAPLTWRSGNHFANTSARAFSIQYQQSGFQGFRQKTDALTDPWVGQDEPANE